MKGSTAPRVGVIDIGSNSIRLVVFDGARRGAFAVVNESEVCELGRGVADGGALTESAMDRAEAAVMRLARLAEASEVGRLDLLATAAMRDARNGADLKARLEAATGREVRIIDADEEARLSALGVAGGFHEAHGIMGDLGGGSLELARLKGDAVGRTTSLALGTLRLIARGGSPKSLGARMGNALDRVDWLDRGRGRDFYAVGGVWRRLAQIFMHHRDHPVSVIHGFGLDRGQAQELCGVIARSSRESLEKMPDCPKRRAAALPSAALLLSHIIERMEPRRVLFSAHGLREGWLFDQLSTRQKARDPLGAAGEDEGFIPRRSTALVDGLASWAAPLFTGGGGPYERLRASACSMSDMAWREPPDHRARHAYYRSLYLPLAGLEHEERAYLALVLAVRYGAPSDHPMVAPILRLLTGEARQDAVILGAALRLAYAVSGGVSGLLSEIALEIDGGVPRLTGGGGGGQPVITETVRRRLDGLGRALTS